MNRRTGIVRGVAAVGLVILLITMVCGLSLAGEKERELMKSQVSKSKGILPENIDVSYHKLFRLPLTGHEYYFGKVTDKMGGKSYSVAIDAGGNVVDHETLQAEEKAAYKAKYGKLNPILHKTLETAAPGEKIRVSLWLKMGERSTEMPRLTRNEAEALGKEGIRLKRIEHFERAKEIHAEVHFPVLNFLNQRGFEARGSDIAPLVFTEVPDHVIRELAERDDVDSIDLVVEGGPEAEIEKTVSVTGGVEAYSARRTEKADVVQSRGITGDGIILAVLEAYGVSDNNPYLNNATHPVTFYNSTVKNIYYHPTAVAGFIASTHGTHRGVAPGIDTILSANAGTYDLTDLQAAASWALGQGASALNNSYYTDANGAMQNSDRWADYVVRHYVDVFVKSAGNRGEETDKYVTSPGLGYNVITVGAIDDFDNADWSDDRMAGLSSSVEPSGREKPEVVAVGCAQWDTGDPTTGMVCTSTADPWTGDVGCGTSYAAPAVTGMVAALTQRNPSLESWPEAVKAIVIASALHNIEGASRLSEIDGAGAIDMAAGDYIAANSWWYVNSVTGNSFTDQKLQIGTIHLYGGERFRAALAYDSNPTADYTSDPLEGDLDLYLYDSSDTLVASSAGVDSWEIIEWNVTLTGDYKLVVWNFGNSLAPEESTYIGVAWWPGHYVLETAIQERGTPTTADDHYRVDTSSATDWWAIAMRSPSAADYDLGLYDASQYGNPVDFIYRAGSSYSGNIVEVVAIDRNHAPSKSYFPIVAQWSGTGNYQIQRAIFGGAISSGNVSQTTTPLFVAKVWDVSVSAGVPKYFRIAPSSGDADLGMLLFKSDPAVSSSWYQGRPNAVASVDIAGAGGAENFAYTSTTSDTLGLVVYNKQGQTINTNWTLYIDDSPPTGTISINAGAAYTNTTGVTLSLSASDSQTGVYQMRFSNDMGAWSAWEPYSTSKSWTLSTGDGFKWVDVQFKNNAEMVTTEFMIYDGIYLDTTAPTGTISINGGATYTNTTSVALTLSATDATSGVYQMRFSNDGSSWSSWEAYGTTKAWTLTSSNGTKTVYVQYRDNALNQSGNFTDTIILDTVAPTGTISINGGATYTNTTSVTLTLSATDGLSGVYQMRFSNDGSSWSGWEAYGTTKAWTLTSSNGTKTVYVQYRDNILNQSGNFTDNIILDTVAPTGSIVINGGAATTNTTSVTLTLSASDATSGVYQMRFSNDGSSWSGWEAYGTTKAWTLTSSNGTKTVYVQYRDNILNQSGNFTDNIILDTVAPTGSIVINGGAATTNTTSVTLTLSASDATSGVYQMRFSNDGSSWSGWEVYGTTKAWTLTSGDGTKTVYVQYRDNALNSSGNFTDTIELITPPAWTAIPGLTPSTPALVWNPSANELQMVVRAADNTLWTATFDSTGNFNNDWAPIPGLTPSIPALAWNPVANKIQMVVRAADNTLWTASFNSIGAFNNDWAPISGLTVSTPALAWNQSANEMLMVVRASDNTLWTATFNSTGAFNDDWTPIPGLTPSIPALAWNPVTNKIQMVVRAADNTLWTASFNSIGAFNNDWAPISGLTASTPALAWDTSTSEIAMVVRASDDTIWFATFDSSGVFNNDWVSISGLTPSSPAMAYLPSIGYLGIVVRASDNTLWELLY